MATPKEVYESPVYKRIANADPNLFTEEIPLGWFKSVYEALGQVLGKEKPVAPHRKYQAILIILTVPVVAMLIWFWYEVSQYGYEAYRKIETKSREHDR